MSAMDDMLISMLGKMTGLSKDDMQKMVKNTIDLLMSLENRLSNIEQKLDTLSGDKQDAEVIELKAIREISNGQ